PQSPAPWNESIAGKDASLYYAEPVVDLPVARSGSSIVEARRASVGTVIYEYSANVTHYPAGYYVLSPSTPAVAGHHQRPVSYVYHRAQSDYGSTIASPISPVTPEYYHYQVESPAPRYSIEQKSHSPGLHASSPFYTGSDHQPNAASNDGYAYKALPVHPLKPGYYTLRNSTHFAYIPLPLPSTPEDRLGENIFANEQQQQQQQQHAPAKHYSLQSSAPLSVTIPTAEKHRFDTYETSKPETSQHAPDVDTVGAQYAYLPPRSTNLTITN
ncbi:hypothetical protein FB639_004886, partial [Coemansia asiatica]